MNRVYVFAPDYRSFRNYVDHEADPKRIYVYVSHPSVTKGVTLTVDNCIALPGFPMEGVQLST